jgi:hypothetical protein
VALRAAVVANADRHAEDLRAVIEDIRAEGTRRGGQWQVSNVGNLVRRLDAGQSRLA